MRNFNETLREAVEGNYIDEYHTQKDLENYELEIDFNYNFACGVALTGEEFSLCWTQYENSLVYTTYQNDDEYIELPKTENLVVSRDDLKAALDKIELPEDFPVETFMDCVQDVCTQIEENYDAYWKIWKETHLKDQDIENGKEIDKKNVEFVEKLFDCFDKCCKNLGFEEDNKIADELGVLQSKSYTRTGNYKHIITYTTINPDCTINWVAYKDEQKVQDVNFRNIVDCEDIQDVFKNHLDPQIEGME